MSELFDLGILRDYDFAIADADNIEYLPDGLATGRLTPKILAPSTHLMPTLIDLKRSPASERDALLKLVRDRCKNAEAPPVALFIKTSVPAAAISRHWNAMQLAQPRPGHKVWLRLHDPRVMHQILRILNPMQRQKLFGLSVAFTYWVGGQWITAERGSADQGRDNADIYGGVEPYAGPTRWDWPRIERIGLVIRALHCAGVRDAAMLSSLGALAEQLMERAAKRHCLSAESDLVEFATRGLMIHPAFDEHPEVAPVIRLQIKSAERSSLSDRLSLIAECVWSQMRQSEKMSTGDRL